MLVTTVTNIVKGETKLVNIRDNHNAMVKMNNACQNKAQEACYQLSRGEDNGGGSSMLPARKKAKKEREKENLLDG